MCILERGVSISRGMMVENVFEMETSEMSVETDKNEEENDTEINVLPLRTNLDLVAKIWYNLRESCPLSLSLGTFERIK